MRLTQAVLVLAALCVALVQAQSGTLRGIEVSDLDRSINPCVDFYQFANGKWRADNPIPPSMPRWSRRWAAGESAKDGLHEILDDVSGGPPLPKGSVEQLIGDFYGACMDQS